MPQQPDDSTPRVDPRLDPTTYHLRVAEILNLGERHHGVVAEIAEATKLSPYHVRRLLHGTDTIKLSVLASLADYLVKKGLLQPHEVPGALFGRAPQGFWTSLAERSRLDIVLGMRHDDRLQDDVVIAADAILQANLLYRLTETEPQTAGGQTTQSGQSSPRSRPLIDLRTIATWTREPDEQKREASYSETRRNVESEYAAIEREGPDRALVALGSIKSNPLIERIVTNCFKLAKPFNSQDETASPRQRACPFLFIYREQDPKPASCCGGMQLSQEDRRNKPGIYYEIDPEKPWAFAPWDDHHDCALLMYRLHKPRRVMEVVAGGYSGYCTKYLASFLKNELRERFWPASLEDEELAIGVFVLRFEHNKGEWNGEEPQIVQLPKAVLTGRVRAKMPNKSRARKPR